MRGALVLGVIVVAVIGLCAWAWIDAGREPVRDMVVAVPLPKSAPEPRK